ncbi:hypothetical protein [Pseudobutyrivibrio sp. JW11]|uniref:hypothetical protein n=1 Tax=Pseudobutyrivibrio sp. JW11 TaxID=1855302 RepID=UPI0015A6A357|nr:hypothetical protein [Pseudobutyrivibrio sp. JW11]
MLNRKNWSTIYETIGNDQPAELPDLGRKSSTEEDFDSSTANKNPTAYDIK